MWGVDITFKHKKLARLANDYSKCQKEMGKSRAKLFHMRLNALASANTLEDLRHSAGKYHELKGDRKGKWACSLDGPYRLISRPHEDPIPIDENGSFIWSEIKGVEIIAIIDYH